MTIPDYQCRPSRPRYLLWFVAVDAVITLLFAPAATTVLTPSQDPLTHAVVWLVLAAATQVSLLIVFLGWTLAHRVKQRRSHL